MVTDRDIVVRGLAAGVDATTTRIGDLATSDAVPIEAQDSVEEAERLILSPSGPSELAWYASGGGPSQPEPTPAFQSSTDVGGLTPLASRGVPDVSLDADPESGYDVVVFK